MKVRNGIDNKSGLEILRGKRLGLITNPSGVDVALRSTADLLHTNFNLCAVYGPEHGIRGDMQDGVRSDSEPDLELAGVRCYSLFGKTLRPTPEMLDGIDVLVYDIQDVGARFYTFIYTLSYAMEECAKLNIPVVVLDRINPLGGSVVEGIRLSPDIQSFVGMYSMPVRYGLTVGEYARFINKSFSIGCELHVVPCLGWERPMLFDETGLHWVAPSPNMPTLDTALVYTGNCIFEATNVSEGRGTTHPYEMIGAPFINTPKLLAALEKHKLPGLIWRPLHFIPTCRKYAGEVCNGVQLHVTDKYAFRPVETGLWLFHEIREQSSKFETYSPNLEKLFGDISILNDDVPKILKRAEEEAREFQNLTREFLLYE